MHVIDPHTPYNPPVSYLVEGALDRTVSSTQKRDPGMGGSVLHHRSNRAARMRRNYDGEVRFVDDQIAHLFRQLAGRKLVGNNTLTVITSDHGEAFGEHGEWQHGKSLYNSQVHVPLIFHYPAMITEPRRIDRPVAASVALMPTILDLAKVFYRIPDMVPGLLPEPSTGPVYGDTWTLFDMPGKHHFSVLNGNRKLITYQASGTMVEAGLFDPIQDWLEQSDLLHKRREQTAATELQALISRYIDSDRYGSDEKIVLNPHKMKELRSLGYVQ